MLETSNATLGATMEQETYSALPIEMGAYGQADQRRATDFAFLMPGVQGNNTTGNATTNTGMVNGPAARARVSAVYIDGSLCARRRQRRPPLRMDRHLGRRRRSVSGPDQRLLGNLRRPGNQNYTIKAGGNKYHGSIYEFFRNTALDTWGFFGTATNPVTGNATKPAEHSNEYGINFSGPLVPSVGWKNKLFFFGNYNGYRYSSTTPTYHLPDIQLSRTGTSVPWDGHERSTIPRVRPTCTAPQYQRPLPLSVWLRSRKPTCAAGNPAPRRSPM